MEAETNEATPSPIRKGIIAQRDGLKVVRLVVKAGARVPEHHANVDVVATVTRGRGRFFIGTSARTIGPGDVVEMAPFVEHSLEADPDSAEGLEIVVVHARLAASDSGIACGR